jgi:uncharacterized protein YecE (DUF72 family)
MDTAPVMQLRAGTSGFSYAEWKGPFYPEKMKSEDMLGFYAAHLDCVEINNTFYRMPKVEMLEGWAKRVPPNFVFVLKASQRITHREKLVNSDESVAYFWKNAQALGPVLGPVLFQLPPTLKRDDERLKRFASCLPKEMRSVLEVRHKSWFDEVPFQVLRDHGISLCYSDVDETDQDDPGLEQPFLATSDWGYVRLRRAAYEPQDLVHWNAQLRAQPWREVFVFFKHEATAPGLALAMQKAWQASPSSCTGEGGQ